MQIDSFLQLDELGEALLQPARTYRQKDIHPAIWDVLRAGEVVDSVGLNGRFVPNDGAQPDLLAECERVSEDTADAVLALHRKDGRRISDEGIARSRARQRRKARELAALLDVSGVIAPEDLTVFDACGGAGHIGFAVHRLREARGLATRSFCVELEHTERRRFGHFKERVVPGADAVFVVADVADYPFVRGDGRTTLVAKHACGPASEFLVRRVNALSGDRRPDCAAIMTCCHAKYAERSTFDPSLSSTGFTREFWQRLLTLADWVSSSFPARAVVGRTAMRIVDVVRTECCPDETGVTVREVLPSSDAVKNHAICLERRV